MVWKFVDTPEHWVTLVAAAIPRPPGGTENRTAFALSMLQTWDA